MEAETWVGDLESALARRRHRRHALDATVDVLAPVEAAGIALNVSAGGLRVAVDRPLPVGRECLVQVRPDGGGEVIECARVAWTREQPDGWLVGLEFLPDS